MSTPVRTLAELTAEAERLGQRFDRALEDTAKFEARLGQVVMAALGNGAPCLYVDDTLRGTIEQVRRARLVQEHSWRVYEVARTAARQ